MVSGERTGFIDAAYFCRNISKKKWNWESSYTNRKADYLPPVRDGILLCEFRKGLYRISGNARAETEYDVVVLDMGNMFPVFRCLESGKIYLPQEQNVPAKGTHRPLRKWKDRRIPPEEKYHDCICRIE